ATDHRWRPDLRHPGTTVQGRHRVLATLSRRTRMIRMLAAVTAFAFLVTAPALAVAQSKASGQTSAKPAVTGTININTASVPQLLATADDVRVAGAVRYLATRLQQARMEAVSRSAAVGWQFVSTAGRYSYAPYLDGNGNGIRSQDIQRAIDPRIGAIERMTD